LGRTRRRARRSAEPLDRMAYTAHCRIARDGSESLIRRGFRLFTAVGAVCISLPAHAHGQDVLVSIFAQMASVIIVVAVLFGVRAFRRHWISGSLGCVSGTIFSWWITGGMPYRQNANLITAIDAVSPIVFSALSILAACLWAKRRERSNKSLERTREK
jgi:hypothetical protein